MTARIPNDSAAPRAEKALPGQNKDFWPVDDLISWRDAPMKTFGEWLSQPRILALRSFRQSSVDTYTAMFSTWLTHLTNARLNVLEAAPPDAERFFAEQALEPISRRRYLQLLDKVYEHLAKCGRAGGSPMRDELLLERELERNLPPCLTEPDQDALEAHLTSLPGWKGARDRGMAALLLGAGLRANELIALPLGQVSASFEVKIQPTGVHREHTSLIVPDGPWRAWYVAWLAVRKSHNIPADFVAPATLKGGKFDPSGLFRRVRNWIATAGIDAEQSGPNLLRSTFANRALTCGRFSVAEVQEFLGHEDARATARHLDSNQYSLAQVVSNRS